MNYYIFNLMVLISLAAPTILGMEKEVENKLPAFDFLEEDDEEKEANALVAEFEQLETSAITILQARLATLVSRTELNDKEEREFLASIKKLAKSCLNPADFPRLVEEITHLIGLMMSESRNSAPAKNVVRFRTEVLRALLQIAVAYRYENIVPDNKNLIKEVSKNHQALRVLLKEFKKYLTTNFSSPYAFDHFYDLSEEMVSDYISLLRENYSSLADRSLKVGEKDSVNKAAFNFPITFSKDAQGNIVVAFTGEYGFRDKLRPFGENIVSWVGGAQAFDQTFMLNGDGTYLRAAQTAYAKVSEKLLNEGDFNIKSLLANGKKIRLIGQGANGVLAELVAYKLKDTFSREKVDNPVYSDENQIQVISFGTFGYLHEGSEAKLNRTLNGDVIRFRFIKDTIAQTPCRDCREVSRLFYTQDRTNITTTSCMGGHHELDYFVGNLINLNVFPLFREYVLYYRLLDIENRILVKVLHLRENKLADKEFAEKERTFATIQSALQHVNDIKRNIITYFTQSRTIDMTNLGQIKFNCIALMDLFSSSIPKSIASIFEMVNRKELLFKRGEVSAHYAKGISEEHVAKEVETLVGQLLDSQSSSAFSKIISLVGQTPQMLLAYDHVLGGKVNLIKALIDYLVSKERETSTQLPEIAKSEDADRLERYLNAMAMGKLTILVGGNFKAAGGATGTLFVLNLEGKKIGLLKRAGHNNLAKQYFGQVAHLSEHTMAQPLSECAAYLFSRKLQFELAPITTMTRFEMGGQMIDGAFMEFVPGQPAQEATFSKVTQYSERELFHFQKMVIFDYLIGNYDRHLDNLFLQDGRIETMTCIDNANGFPKCGPNLINGHNMYGWGKFAIAKNNFTRDVVEFIHNLNIQDIRLTMEHIESLYPKFLSQEMTSYLMARVNVLKKMSTDDSPEELAKIRTRKEIDQFLKDRD